MRILHVAPYCAEAWAYGGIPRVVNALTRAQAALGHEVTVCATDARDASSRLASPAGARSRRAWPPLFPADRLELRVFPNLSNTLAYHAQGFLPRGMFAWLRDHVRDFDVVHIHACRNLPGLMAAHFCRGLGVPYVLTPNGTAPNIERRRLAKAFVDAAAGRRMLRGAAAIVAVSEAERVQLHALGIDDRRIVPIPNPIELAEFEPPIARDGASPLIVFLGKITPRKRLDVLIRAFASLRADAELIVAGNDMGGLDDMRRLAVELGVVGRVRTPGLLQGRDRLSLLANADVVVYPSEHEVFGLVPLEAMLCGTPVVVAGDSGCGEIVRRLGGGRVVTTGDAAGLVGAIDEILSARADCRAEACAAAGRIRSEFGAEIVAARTLDLYSRVSIVVTPSAAGVSVVIPARNGAATIKQAIERIEAQAGARPFEILVVDDGSGDDTRERLRPLADAGRIRVLAGRGAGPSAAINTALPVARHPYIAQIDQDVYVERGWLDRLCATLDADLALGAVQGHYARSGSAPLLARVTALDVEQRYTALAHGRTSHVCTGNTVYRAKALNEIGGFHERIGYGHDVDVSYRLQRAGWRLAHCAQARSVHHWRSSITGYLRQQYGFGYGRLDVVNRHPARVAGDSVAPLLMMAHPMLFGAALSLVVTGSWLTLSGRPAPALLTLGFSLFALLVAERTVAGVRAFVRFGDAAALLFPVAHLGRDAAWVAATCVWSWRRVGGLTSSPDQSMRAAQRPAIPKASAPAFIPRSARTIAIIPVHNEASSIARVVAELREVRPDLDVLLVDDGSTDSTASVIARLDVRSLRLPERLGVGSAMRAGLRYARDLGYDSAVRIDGDGQHRAADIARLLAPLAAGAADVVLGSRFLESPGTRATATRLAQRLLAACISRLTGRRVTDPTSGFFAFGPRAMKMLVEHHPTGYPEPELQLLLTRKRLRVVEVPVDARRRLGGRTSLTAPRSMFAAARVILAMVVVPLRPSDGSADAD